MTALLGQVTTSADDLIRDELLGWLGSKRRHVIAQVEIPQGNQGWVAPDDVTDEQVLEDYREVLLHVLVETSTHAGHLDICRELADGGQRLVLDQPD